MSDFDSKLDSLKRGTDGLKAPEGFDAALNAKLVAAAALPPAAAGAGLAWGLKLLIGVVAFGAAGGGVWWATADQEVVHAPVVQTEPRAASPASVVPSRVPQPMVHEVPRVAVAPTPATSTTAAPAGEVPEVTPPPPPVVAPALAPLDGGGAAVSSIQTTVSETVTTVAHDTVMSCGRPVDRIDLVSLGPARDALRQRAGEAKDVLSAIVDTRGARPSKPQGDDVVAVGRFVFDGGPGIHGISGDVKMIEGWFVVSGARRDRIEVVVNEYRPIALSLEALSHGRHYVGDVQLHWVGARPPDDRQLRVSVQGVSANARVRLFPMSCSRDGQWNASWIPAADVPSTRFEVVFKNLSATRYRLAAYAPGAEPAWTEASTIDSRSASAIIPLAPERLAHVELISGRSEVALSKPWTPAPGVSLQFKPGRDVGSLCLDGSEWIAHAVQGPMESVRPMETEELLRGRTSCLVFDTAIVFQSLTTRKMVAAEFRR
ncbi:MAG: hypothetical protein QM723_32230 [Myxococcaceae bacterium]